MPRGGARPNSGPKKGQKYKKTIEEELRIESLKELLMPHAQEVSSVLVEKALTGDVSAIKEFNDRLLGKSPQAITGPGGRDIMPGVIFLPLVNESDE